MSELSEFFVKEFLSIQLNATLEVHGKRQIGDHHAVLYIVRLWILL